MLIASLEDFKVPGKSRRKTLEAPCSRSARADARAREPAPPVMTTLPPTAKRWAARSMAEVLSIGGSGAVRGFDAVERVMWGSVLALRDARSS